MLVTSQQPKAWGTATQWGATHPSHAAPRRSIELSQVPDRKAGVSSTLLQVEGELCPLRIFPRRKQVSQSEGLKAPPPKQPSPSTPWPHRGASGPASGSRYHVPGSEGGRGSCPHSRRGAGLSDVPGHITSPAGLKAAWPGLFRPTAGPGEGAWSPTWAAPRSRGRPPCSGAL